MDAAAPARVLTVPFRAARSGRGPLTWAQREIWDGSEALRPRHAYFNLQRTLALPAGTGVAAVAGAVRALVEWAEALRTTVGRDADGQPEQRVADRGTYPLAVHEAGMRPPAAVADVLAAELAAHPFADEEWPLLAAVVANGETAHHLVLVACHVAVDRFALDQVCTRLRGLLADPLDQPPAGPHPLDRARYEASDAGRRAGGRALDFWRRTLAGTPQAMFAVTPDAGPRPWPSVEMDSVAVAIAARHLAQRYRTSAGEVILATAAAMLAARTGHRTVVLRLLAGNRFTRAVRTMVGTCVQPALFRVDIGEGTLADLVRRTWDAVVLANRHAAYPPHALRTVLDDLNLARGVHLDLGCYFHSRRDADASTPPHGDPADLDSVRRHTVMRRGAVWNRHRRFSLEVHTGAGSTWLRLDADPAALPAPAVRAFLCGIEELLVRAVHAEVPLADVAALTGTAAMTQADRPYPLDRLDHGWIDPAAVEDVLAGLGPVAAARVRVDAGELIADVATTEPDLTVAMLHRACVAALPARPDAGAPHHYVVRLADPGRPGADPSADADPWWRSAPVLDRGTGRPAGRPPSSTYVTE